MPESEILLTMAEVAVAFAGFTALASVFGDRKARDDPRLSSHLLRGMIESSLLVVFFAFLPLVLDRTPLASASVWRIASGVCAASWISAATVYARKGARLRRELKAPSESGYFLPVVPALALGNGMFLITAGGAVDSWAGGAYSVGLLCLLAISAISFVRFFFGAYEQTTNE